MTISKWDVWLANVPYEEGIGSKVRPVVVIEEPSPAVIVFKMTKHEPRTAFSNEYAVKNWQGAGLKVQTTIRMWQTITLDGSAFLRKLGVLQPIDIVEVRKVLDAE